MRLRWVAAGLAAAVVFGMVLFEVTMQPTPTDRAVLATIFAAMVAATMAAAWWLPRLAKRSRSLALSLAALPVAAIVVVTAAVTLAANQMFFSSHDFSLLLVVLATGLLGAVVFAVVVSRAWAGELSTMRVTADRIASGAFDARTGIDRSDELGRLAGAIDDMASKLHEASQAKLRADEERRAFLAAIGHDLRTPLASMRAAIEAMSDGIATDPQRYLSAMEHDVVALSSLVDNLFLLTRIESGDIEIDRSKADVGELADEAIEVLRPVAARAGVELRLDAPPQRMLSRGPEAVGRVLRNLLDNAIRYAPSGTEVLVSLTNGDGVTVRVTDAGPGFDPGFLDDAFSSFRRADPARNRETGGAGLGLAIAHGFVTALGGSIWAEPGPGGKVTFRLPDASDRHTNR